MLLSKHRSEVIGRKSSLIEFEQPIQFNIRDMWGGFQLAYLL